MFLRPFSAHYCQSYTHAIVGSGKSIAVSMEMSTFGDADARVGGMLRRTCSDDLCMMVEEERADLATEKGLVQVYELRLE